MDMNWDKLQEMVRDGGPGVLRSMGSPRTGHNLAIEQQQTTIWRNWAVSREIVQFSSVAQSCLTLCDPMNRSTPGLPFHHQLPESTQTHVH